MYSTDAMQYGFFPFSFTLQEPFPWVYPAACGYGVAESEKQPAQGFGGLLVYVLEGEGELRLEDQVFAYEADCIAVAQDASLLFLNPKTKTEYLFLTLHNAGDLLRRIARFGFSRKIQGGCRADRLLGRICYNASTSRSGSVYSASADAFQLLMELAEHLESGQGAYPVLIQQALNIIRQDFAFLTGVDELADRLGVSREHLIRSFRSATGQSPGQCLQSVKLDNARLMLQNRDYSIETVADMTGYSGANYFCKVFRRATGESPGEYRTRTLGFVKPDAESQKQMNKLEEIYHI